METPATALERALAARASSKHRATLLKPRAANPPSMAVLAVRCKGCGILLPTGVRTGWVARPVLGPRAYACPGCGLRADYAAADYVDLAVTG